MMMHEIMDGNTCFDISSVFSGSPYPYADTQYESEDKFRPQKNHQ